MYVFDFYSYIGVWGDMLKLAEMAFSVCCNLLLLRIFEVSSLHHPYIILTFPLVLLRFCFSLGRVGGGDRGRWGRGGWGDLLFAGWVRRAGLDVLKMVRCAIWFCFSRFLLIRRIEGLAMARLLFRREGCCCLLVWMV